MLLGYFGFSEKDLKKIYTDDMKVFRLENEDMINIEEENSIMESYAVCLNSPWSQADEKWVVECNCINAYIPMDENEPTFRCYYQVVGCDGITSRVYGYGNEQQEALKECIKNFDLLQNNFNKEDISF